MPRPGGPARSTCSRASPRPRAASSAIDELLAQPLLADELVERAGPERAIELLVALGLEHGRDEPRRAHAACLSASRTRSSGGSAGSIAASTDSASTSGVAELDEGVAGDEMAVAFGGRLDVAGQRPLQLEDDALRRLSPDAGNRLEPRRVLARDRAAQLGRRRARDDRERDLRADARDREQLLEELSLGGVGEAVQLEGVLADVEVRLDRHLLRASGLRERARRRLDEIADPAHVEHEAVRPAPDGLAAKLRDHDATCFKSGGASAWQMATASASAAWCGSGVASSPRIALTIRCICALSARP